MGQNRTSFFSALAYLYFACLILILPFRWILGWMLAIVIHELGHYVAVLICGGRIISLSLAQGGLDMDVTPLPNLRKFFCFIAGPVFGLLPVFWCCWFPELAVFSFILTVYNMIPVRPLDGGRLLELLLGGYGVIYCVIERMILILTVVICFVVSIHHSLGMLPIAVAVQLIVKNRKITCKRQVPAVQ